MNPEGYYKTGCIQEGRYMSKISKKPGSRNIKTPDQDAVNELKRAFVYNLFYNQGKPVEAATMNDFYMAVAHTIRDRMQHLFVNNIENFQERSTRIVCYLSAEFLMGPHLANNMINLGLYDQVGSALEETGLDIKEIIDHEVEPGLGNGGLGRLAACYLDSLATLQIPAIGYGIRYEHGMFNQVIIDGWQKELSDRWLHLGNPWEIKKPELAFEIGFGGHTESYQDDTGNYRVRWIPARMVNAVAYDTPVPGYKVNNINLLRLWSAEAVESFDFEEFNTGDYFGATEEKVKAENITKVLYPNDEQYQGKQLRLEQQFFFVSASLQDMIRLQQSNFGSLDNLHDTFAAQLNDTHPSVAVPELMRLLMDVHGMEWGSAWEITKKTISYTNHTLLPEAMEKWPMALFASLLPRHIEIILEINHRFLDEVRVKFPDDEGRLGRMSIIDESGGKYVRMANLACVGSHAINGVAALHTRLLKEQTLKDFDTLWPGRISNKTNGVTPRRWMVVSNPRLSSLITESIGEEWITELSQLKKLENFVDDSSFRDLWRKVQEENKADVAAMAKANGILVDPCSMFDVQVKRIHEYKRQHLNVLHIITLYNRIKANPGMEITPRSFVFGGKAAPSYFMAKLIIKLINSVADVVNNDPDVADRLKVFFIPNYNVKTGHTVYPMADLSEQISLAGKEASGTGNMKFAMNGALTIGTLDGANVEIREEVGAENFFLFGLTVQEVMELRASGYNPMDRYSQDDELRAVIDLIGSGHFSGGDRELFRPLLDALLYRDEYMLLADYRSYIECQDRAGRAFLNQDDWTRMSILNVARMGKFSSDRSIREYCEEIWNVKPQRTELKWERIPEEGLMLRKLKP
jgi:starch phosphorylase